MSVQDYVVMNTGGKQQFGIQGYKMVGTTAFDKPFVPKIVSGKKTTYIDDAVRSKKNVPDFKYNVAGDMNRTGHKSDLERDIRRT